MREEVDGNFHKQELLETEQTVFRIDNVIKRIIAQVKNLCCPLVNN